MTNLDTNPSVSPEPEEVSVMRQYFAKALDTVINYAAISKEVASLREEIAVMRNDLEKLRSQNAWLDEQVSRLRQERDQAISDANSAKHGRDQAQQDNENLRVEVDLANKRVTSLLDQVDALKHERDEALTYQLTLEEQLKSAHSKLERFLALADEIDPPQEPELVKPSNVESFPVQPTVEGSIVQEPSNTTYDPITGTYR